MYVTPGAIIGPALEAREDCLALLHMLVLDGELKNALQLLALRQQLVTFFVPSVIM